MMTSSDVEILALSSQISMHRISWISLQFLLNVTKPQIWLGNTQHWNKQLNKTKNLIATRLHRKYWFKQRYQFKIPHGLSRLKTSLFHILQVSRVNLYLFFPGGLLVFFYGKSPHLVSTCKWLKHNNWNYFLEVLKGSW